METKVRWHNCGDAFSPPATTAAHRVALNRAQQILDLIDELQIHERKAPTTEVQGTLRLAIQHLKNDYNRQVERLESI